MSNLTATKEEVDLALDYLRYHEGLVFPHGQKPIQGNQDRFDRFYVITNKAEWDAHSWNPPQAGIDYAPRYRTFDTEASLKPTWAKVIEAVGTVTSLDLRRTLSRDIRREETRRIAAAYGADNVQDEMLYRLRASADDLAPKDAERDRLHSKANALTASLGSMTVAELRAFDPTDDAHWRAA